jgi:AraC-like DNA-binding protein
MIISVNLSICWNSLSRSEIILKQQADFGTDTGKSSITAPDESAIPAPEDKLLKKVIGMMKDNIANPDFHVNFICSKLYISRTQLYRKIETLTGYSPARLMRLLRLKSAAAMFRKGHNNVAQVMYKVGFSNQSNFARTLQGVLRHQSFCLY